MQYVIFGVNGFIGSYLFERLKKDGFHVLGTSRRSQSEEKVVYYDIQQGNMDKIQFLIKERGRTAIICIAEPNIDKCYDNYRQAYDINVVGTKKLIQKLVKEGFQVIFFSTDNVFDGIRGNYTEESETCAINKYGGMKAEMEHYLLTNMPEVCIFRIPKVVSTFRKKQNVFTEWENKIATGVVRCIKGNRISFVCVEDIYQACLLASERRMHGIYNIVGDRAFSRAELARKFYSQLGIWDMDIQECDLGEFSFKDRRPLDISMSNQKFKSETGYRFLSMDTVIKLYCENRGNEPERKDI